MRVVGWNMGRAMDAVADAHGSAWHFLESLDADIAFVQEAIPPEWIRERFDIHAESFTDVPWCSAVVARRDLLRRVAPPVLAGFYWYVATAEVTLSDGSDLLVGSVHATAKLAFQKQLAGLDQALIRRSPESAPWMSDLAYFAYQELALGRRFIVGGDWNISRVFDTATNEGGAEFYARAERDGWVETHLRLHNEETQTWLRKSNRPCMMDHMFCDEGLAAHLVGSRALVDTVSFLGLSDHAPLVVDFDLEAMAAAKVVV